MIETISQTKSVVAYDNNKLAFVAISYETFLELFNIGHETNEMNNKRYIEVISGKKETIKGE